MSNRIRVRFLFGGLVLALVLLGCSTETTTAAKDGTGVTTATVANADPRPVVAKATSTLPVTVRGFDGVDVTVTDTSRIVAADRYGTLAQTVFGLGLGDRLVGRSTAAAFPAAKNIPDVTPGGSAMTTEAILNLNPTVILTDTSIGPKKVQDQLRAAGIAVVYFDPARTLESVVPQIDAVAQALGVPQQGKALADRTEGEIAAAGTHVPKNADPLRIAFLYMRGPAITMIAGPGSGADALIEALGAKDAGTESGLTQQFVPITSEALIAAAPDVFLMMTDGLASIGGPDGLQKIPGVAQTPAGKNKRVVDMQDSELLSFGPNTGEVLSALAGALYPQHT
ncbi:heme/hemin ABC transporter substrate-binding protein [Antrihabitans cavernicola]|uniref:ABC transporter substrate-binding protein n=1 Tax=Antrihabitans cavernicola TaxID=2495913 RepID=A0A5A7SCK6_9NOCA|nr:ABC transporter substrate-binding protein [Spelaeibacter cavernicola]KAA0023626.1 ABC transporter substrate-binding protein [Spelaeibacter cavernicola]